MPSGQRKIAPQLGELRVAVLLGLTSFLIYLILAGPTFYWLDSSELVAAAWGLGVAHPPGHPLHSLLGHLFCFLPMGTLSFRVTLCSAFCAAGAISFIALISDCVLKRAVGTTAKHRWIRPLMIAISTLTLGLSYALGFQAVRTEVYALNLFLVTAAVYLTLRWEHQRDHRFLFAAALVLGLGLCNHHLLVILAVPALLLFVLLCPGPFTAAKSENPVSGEAEQVPAAEPPSPLPGTPPDDPSRQIRRCLIGIILAGGLGLSTLAYLPLRAQQLPETNWGCPTTWDRFFWVVSAQAFQKAPRSVAAPTVQERARGTFFALLGGLTPLATLLSFGGLYLLWRRRPTRKVALLLTMLVVFNLLSPFFVGFDPLNPDAQGYLAVALAFLVPPLAYFLTLIGEAAARLGSPAPDSPQQKPDAQPSRWKQARPTSRVGPVFTLVLASLLPLGQGYASLTACDLRNHWAADETARQMLDQAPRTFVLTSYFESIFNAWALQTTADYRPDLTIMHRNFLRQPGYAECLARKHHILRQEMLRWRHAEKILEPDLDRLATQRPVALEYDLNLPPELLPHLSPAGLLFSYAPRPTAEKGLAAHQQAIQAWEHALVDSLGDNETRRTIVWTHYLMTHFACQEGRRAMAHFHFTEARRLGPRDQSLELLGRQCGLIK